MMMCVKVLVNCEVLLKVLEERNRLGGGTGGSLQLSLSPGTVVCPTDSLVGVGDGEGLGALPGMPGASLQTHTRVGACTHVYTARRGPQLVGG